ncbi:GNAT family N-acetyltransferase [Geosporobacter ferrireducens]|uniref:GNAT family N-acetyltransferase n=1 Tax=Geosporobacter ferrireducens TaxID=1424294 RepID=UPI003AB9373C
MLSFYQWAIALKGNKQPIGAIGLFVVNENDLCGDVGYCVGKKYWGQGFATEVLNNEEELTYVYGKIV